MQYKGLLSPVNIGGQEIKNRVVMAPVANVGMAFSDGAPTDYYVSFLEERARGGVGLIITANTEVDPEHRVGLGMHSPRMLPAWARLVSAIHQYGTKILLQLAHRGGTGEREVTGVQPIAPSAIRCPLYTEVPRELKDWEIQRLIEKFVQAALWAKQAHFDGVELHAAHGHDIIEHFISPALNKRSGRYGGSFEGRMRFIEEIIYGIRRICGKEFMIGVKLSAYEHLEGGIDLELAKQIALYLKKVGVDYLHVASAVWGLGGHRYLSVGPLYSPPDEVISLTKEIKNTVQGLPVIAATNITTPDFAEALIVKKGFDLVALGRALIADPYWVKKVEHGHVADIQPCIRCNECHLQMSYRKLWRCTVNPYLGWRGGQDRIEVSRRSKLVVVVGGGPAGMQAALTAALRGHRVHLFERSEDLGGNLAVASIPPFKKELRRLLDFYRRQVEKNEVAVHLETEVSASQVKDLSPDVVIVAAGADYTMPDIPGIERGHVMTATEALLKSEEVGERVLILGCGSIGAETAWHLALAGRCVTVIDILPKDKLLHNEHANNRNVLLWNLKEKGVCILSKTAVQEIGHGRALLNREGEDRLVSVDTIVIATGMKPRTDLINVLRGELKHILIVPIGDCLRPGKLGDAIHGAHRLANRI